MKPRVFISHSAKEPESAAVRDALGAALRASGRYEVLLDAATLQPGDPWRCRINLWLGACDAAVVLLSERALASPYLTYETSVLAYRNAALDPTFLILPVLLGEVTLEALRRSYLAPAQLDERQLVRGTPEEIVAAVLSRLAGASFREETPVEKRARKVADLLRNRELTADRLGAAGSRAAIDLSWLSAGSDLPLRLAVRLMSVGMTAAIPAILALRQHIAPIDQAEWVRRMVDLVASSWVDLRCVGRIPSIAKGREAVRAFGINARRWDAAKMYVVCASHEDPEGTWYWTSCTGICGEEDGAVAGEVRRALQAKLNTSAADLPLDLAALHQSGQPVIVGLDCTGMTEETLAGLHRELPHVSFFLLTGTEGEEGSRLDSAMVEMLYPKLIEGEEADFLREYQTFERSVRPR